MISSAVLDSCTGVKAHGMRYQLNGNGTKFAFEYFNNVTSTSNSDSKIYRKLFYQFSALIDRI